MATAMASRCSFDGVQLMPKAETRTAVLNGENALRLTRISKAERRTAWL